MKVVPKMIGNKIARILQPLMDSGLIGVKETGVLSQVSKEVSQLTTEQERKHLGRRRFANGSAL